MPHCSVQHMVACAPEPTLACLSAAGACCWLMTCCCGGMFIWHLPSVTQHRLCCARQTQQWQDLWLCLPGAQTAELVAPVGIPEPLLSMFTPVQLQSSITPSAPPPCCHHSQGWKSWGAASCGVQGERCTCCPGEAFTHRKESNCSV